MRLIYLIIIFICHPLIVLFAQDNSFVQVKGKQFYKNGQPYYFIGTNAWYFMNIGSTGETGDRKRVIKELDQLQKTGINNIRIMAGSEGPQKEPWRVTPALQEKPGEYNQKLLEGLDFVITEAAKRDIKLVLCLNNFFHWSGGMAQYVSWVENTPIPYPDNKDSDWNIFQNYSSNFFVNPKAKELFKKFVTTLVKRKNTLNGKMYLNDPAILAWQLANEPRGRNNIVEYIKWVDNMAAYIHSLDKNHLVSLGGEGILPSKNAETAFQFVSRSKHLDYLTMHVWIENWSIYKPKKPEETFANAMKYAEDYMNAHFEIARSVNKPIVLEEFGISRDQGEYDPKGTTKYREKYYQFIFDKIYKSAQNNDVFAGCNFWSWSGEGKPVTPAGFWKKGDELIGDPPHEKQGWYSVYSDDKSTLKLIYDYIDKIEQLDVK